MVAQASQHLREAQSGLFLISQGEKQEERDKSCCRPPCVNVLHGQQVRCSHSLPSLTVEPHRRGRRQNEDMIFIYIYIYSAFSAVFPDASSDFFCVARRCIKRLNSE